MLLFSDVWAPQDPCGRRGFRGQGDSVPARPGCSGEKPSRSRCSRAGPRGTFAASSLGATSDARNPSAGVQVL